MLDSDFEFSTPNAQCALWWSRVPEMENERLGVIGNFKAEEVRAGVEILNVAVEKLRARGCTMAVGPMDGNTWRRYRALTERGDEPVFFMEPDNPGTWPEMFEQAGFAPLSNYVSVLVSDLARNDPREASAHEKFRGAGVVFRSLRPKEFENELREIYKISRESFTRNFLYTEIPEKEFMQQYLPYREKIIPELVIIAECEGRPVGYLFGIPNYAEAVRCAPMKTAIAKTLAVLPAHRCMGFGTALLNLFNQRAAEAGFTRVIHALQREGNSIRNISNPMGRVMRRYTLYAKRIDS